MKSNGIYKLSGSSMQENVQKKKIRKLISKTIRQWHFHNEF